MLEWALRVRPRDSLGAIPARHLGPMHGVATSERRSPCGTPSARCDQRGSPRCTATLATPCSCRATRLALPRCCAGMGAEPDNPAVWVGHDSLSVLPGPSSALPPWTGRPSADPAATILPLALLAAAGRPGGKRTAVGPLLVARGRWDEPARRLAGGATRARRLAAARGACADARQRAGVACAARCARSPSRGTAWRSGCGLRHSPCRSQVSARCTRR